MYNESLVNALNADRDRQYDEWERLRAQREILAQRAAADGAVDGGTRGASRSHHRAFHFGRVATR